MTAHIKNAGLTDYMSTDYDTHFSKGFGFMERDFSELDKAELISIYANLGRSGCDFKDALACEICKRIAQLTDEQFWHFVISNEKVAAIMDQRGHRLYYSRG